MVTVVVDSFGVLGAALIAAPILIAFVALVMEARNRADREESRFFFRQGQSEAGGRGFPASSSGASAQESGLS